MQYRQAGDRHPAMVNVFGNLTLQVRISLCRAVIRLRPHRGGVTVSLSRWRRRRHQMLYSDALCRIAMHGSACIVSLHEKGKRWCVNMQSSMKKMGVGGSRSTTCTSTKRSVRTVVRAVQRSIAERCQVGEGRCERSEEWWRSERVQNACARRRRGKQRGRAVAHGAHQRLRHDDRIGCQLLVLHHDA